MSKKIFLDIGHAGKPYDPGATNGSRHEADDVLRLGFAVREILLFRGCSVAMSRAGSINLTLAQRTNAAAAFGADVCVSLHRNAFGDPTANGIETIVYTTPSDASLKIATEVQKRLVAVANQKDRGVKKQNLHMVRVPKMPSILVEAGFISNAADNTAFDSHFDSYALAIADGLCAGLGVKVDTTEEKQQEEKTMNEKRYNTVEELPEWARPTIQHLIDTGALQGDGTGLDLSMDMVRMFVVLGRVW